MSKYRCKRCGYSGDELIFQFNDYTYALATNEEEPEYVAKPPKWAPDGDAEIGEPVGCPKCRNWGEGEFEIVE